MFLSDETMKHLGAAEQFFKDLPENAFELLLNVLTCLLVFVVGVFLTRLLRKIVKKAMKKAKAEEGAISFVDSFLKLLLYFVLVAFIAIQFGVDTAAIATILGSVSVAIGLAVQGSLSNLAGGILILVLKPFKIGDYIIEANGKEGKVIDIAVFYTKLETYNREVVILPNGTLANSTITNLTANPLRRIQKNFSVSYGTDIEEARTVILNCLEEIEQIKKNEPIRIGIQEMKDSAVELVVTFFVENDEYWNMYYLVPEKVKRAFKENNIEIPYPQMDIHMK